MEASSSNLERLVNQWKSNDVDVKVDALTKLQTEFEADAELTDPECFLNIFKTSLRTSNQHLTNAAIAGLPSLLPRLISRPSVFTSLAHSASSSTPSTPQSAFIDVSVLRQALLAFMSSGGIIDRLGDKEKAQSKAREALVILGGYAFRSGASSTMSSRSKDNKGPEPPIVIFERFFKEVGLGSKLWKVREQCILTLVNIRRAHHQFPIRPYLTLLVDCLEDTDAHVRECARQSVVELFSGPGVTDAARADLKKEMSKKGVRKGIVDGVLSKLLGTPNNVPSQEVSGNGDSPTSGPRDYVPPSLLLQGKKQRVASQNGLSKASSQANIKEVARPISRPTSPPASSADESMDVRPVYIASVKDLENEFMAMAKSFEGKETEHNWAGREQAIIRVRGMLKGDVHLRYAEVFLSLLKDGFIQWSLKTLASLRTTVASNTTTLYSELAIALGTALDPFCEVLLTNLLKMAGFTKKITAQQSQACVSTIISRTSPQPRVILPLLWNTLQEKTAQSRTFVVAHLKQYMELHGHRLRSQFENGGNLDLLEKCISKALGDSNPAVRETARVLYWVFNGIWHEHAQELLENLDTTARKQLERVRPSVSRTADIPPTTPSATKKSSVAAAIAASRAKAKAIASAPPTLRHQATAASHVPFSKRSDSPSLSPRSRTNSITRMPPSPTSPSVTRTNPGMGRSVSSSAVSSLRSRTTSGGSTRSPSPTPGERITSVRRTSSPLVTRSLSPKSNSTLRKAMQVALPSSPPHSTGQLSPTSKNNKTAPYMPVSSRFSTTFPQLFGETDESLLLAQVVPIPDGTDSGDDDSVDLMSFSAPLETFSPMKPVVKSTGLATPRSISSKNPDSISNALSSDSVTNPGNELPVVEDALRARAEQAESAAERLLELVEPEDEGIQGSIPILPTSLLVSDNNGQPTPKIRSKDKDDIKLNHTSTLPATPDKRSTAILRQAALFKDSPAYKGNSSSLLDVLKGEESESAWVRKCRTVLARATSNTINSSIDELELYINKLNDGTAAPEDLLRIAFICSNNFVPNPATPPHSPRGDPSSPSPFVTSTSLHSLAPGIWEKNKTFERLLNGLMAYMDSKKGEEEIEYGLIIVWEMLKSQAPYLEGREGDIFSMLLRVRYRNELNILEATNSIRDILTAKIDPVYGLTTMHASLRAFHAEAPPQSSETDMKAATYAFGLIALGKFILRLPAEIAEEELPRLKMTLISALNDRSSLIVRESAAALIIAAQLVLRDETHLFALLDGLADDKKNLLTYLFDKHGARGLTARTGPSGMQRLEKEIRRLDSRMSTPSRTFS